MSLDLPPISTLALPGRRPRAGTDAVKDYKTALGFEQMLARPAGQEHGRREQLARRGPVRLDHAGHADLAL